MVIDKSTTKHPGASCETVYEQRYMVPSDKADGSCGSELRLLPSLALWTDPACMMELSTPESLFLGVIHKAWEYVFQNGTL